MRTGHSPTAATEEAIARIVRFYPDFDGALIAVSKSGQYGKSQTNPVDAGVYFKSFFCIIVVYCLNIIL